MKIGFDGKRATHNFRGLGNYSRGLIEGLYQYSQHELFLFTPPFKHERTINWVKNHPNLNIVTPESLLLKKVPSIWRSFLLEKELNKHKLDIYHGLSHELPKLTSKHKFKSVVTIHDLIFIRYPEFFPWLDRKVYQRKFQYAVSNADLVLAICEQTKQDILEFLKCDERKIKIHYQSASPIFLNESTANEITGIKNKYKINRPFILHVGAFEERKNQKKTILSYLKSKSSKDYDLVLIGNGKKYLQECLQLIQEHQAHNRIHILNNIPFPELPILYQAAELFFFPSFFEGFGIPIVEALFSKTPVITSIGSCFPESAGPDSLFINPNDIEQMAATLDQVLGDKNLQERMINNGYDYAKRFTLQESTTSLLGHYSQLINN